MNPKVTSPGWTETSESETSFPPYVVTWFHRCPILKLPNSAPHFYAVLHSQAFTQWHQYWYFYHHFTRKISPNGTLSLTVLLTLLMQQTCMEYEDAIHQHSHAWKWEIRLSHFRLKLPKYPASQSTFIILVGHDKAIYELVPTYINGPRHLLSLFCSPVTWRF